MKLLNEHEVRYLLVGGFAVSYHGYPRTTADIDLWIDVEAQNAARVLNVVNEFGLTSPDLTTATFLIPDQIFRMGFPPLRIELLTGISGVEFEECYTSRIQGEIDDITVAIINLTHLKANKKASGRFKDLNDLENLP
ncbi:hypothetical protein [Acanthopleuribacter pedis]|uniref:Nucleotidyltransferase n=1 Tax=Acanthopleuribacter pedis TaxID=442870 RepID=A0A8J7U6V3_9BACT|nr:hypothetical protein [Acanthopleuribacter pedis]MBO1323162.1 hypothetical protein [Acanthopleuribacter pedis]